MKQEQRKKIKKSGVWSLIIGIVFCLTYLIVSILLLGEGEEQWFLCLSPVGLCGGFLFIVGFVLLIILLFIPLEESPERRSEDSGEGTPQERNGPGGGDL